MSNRNFRQMLEKKWGEGKFASIGLDSKLENIPEVVQVSDSEHPENYLGLNVESTILGFNEGIVNKTMDLVCAYKLNLAFYTEYDDKGIEALLYTIKYIHSAAPDVPVILDAKWADIGNISSDYARFAFEYMDADAITVHPYLGREALQTFLDHKNRGIIVLCRTNNPGAGEFQDLNVEIRDYELAKKLGIPSAIEYYMNGGGHSPTCKFWEYVAHSVAKVWNKNGNCALVVGATYPDELRAVRAIADDIPILIPGVGAQGGDIEKTVAAGKNSRGAGMIINSSRDIIFALNDCHFAEAARHEILKLHELINQYR